MKKTALVLGATGGIGGEVARHLLDHGWTVKAMVRGGDASKRDARIEWIAGDAMNAKDVRIAAQDTSLIVHAVNPPGYKNWAQLVLPMIDNTIQAAKAVNARILLPGTIYNYGSESSEVLSEDTPQLPNTRKGKIRKELEDRLREASKNGVRVLIVRCGDFYGPRPGSNWFSQGMVKPGKPVSSISYPGKKGVGHAWAYLPDVAETMVQLVEQEERLETFETFHFAGNWDHDGKQMIQAIQRTAGKKNISVRQVPWLLFKILSPFVVLFKELQEMRYLWMKPYRLDNHRLVKFLGYEPATPLDEAVRETLRGLGCIS